MRHHRDTVAGHYDVQLDGVGAGTDGILERSQRVFGPERSRAAMSVHSHFPHCNTITVVTGLSRRQLLSGMAAASLASAQDTQTGQFRRQNGPKARATPPVCLFSDQIMKVGYDELGGILKMLGFEGCDLADSPAATSRRSMPTWISCAPSRP